MYVADVQAGSASIWSWIKQPGVAIIRQRLKLAGMQRSEPGTNAIVTLRRQQASWPGD